MILKQSLFVSFFFWRFLKQCFALEKKIYSRIKKKRMDNIRKHMVCLFEITVNYNMKQITIEGINITIDFDELYVIEYDSFDCKMILRQSNLCVNISYDLTLFYCENKITEFRFVEDNYGVPREYIKDDKGYYYLLSHNICVKNKQCRDPYLCYENANLCIY